MTLSTVSVDAGMLLTKHMLYFVSRLVEFQTLTDMTSLSGSRVKIEPEVCRLKSQRLHMCLPSVFQARAKLETLKVGQGMFNKFIRTRTEMFDWSTQFV